MAVVATGPVPALRVRPAASPASSDATAMVVLLRQPTRRPAVVRKPLNSRPRTRSGGLVQIHRSSASPCPAGGPFHNRPSAGSVHC
jgi:hypothetical protein